MYIPVLCGLDKSEDVYRLCTTGGGKVEIVSTERQAVDVNEP